jgi:hypothetical protein
MYTTKDILRNENDIKRFDKDWFHIGRAYRIEDNRGVRCIALLNDITATKLYFVYVDVSYNNAVEDFVINIDDMDIYEYVIQELHI